MSDPERKPSFFRTKIEQIEREHTLWIALHKMAEGLLLEAETADDDFDEQEGVSFPIASRFEWMVNIFRLQDAPVLYNRWNQPLTEVVEVDLYVAVDGEPYNRTITDYGKCPITVSPRGVVYTATGEHLSELELQGLMNDMSEFRSRA